MVLELHVLKDAASGSLRIRIATRRALAVKYDRSRAISLHLAKADATSTFCIITRTLRKALRIFESLSLGVE